jgi:hypothetical protein
MDNPENNPNRLVSISEVEKMIEDAITKHNIQATIISAVLGFSVMGFYAHGLITLVK